MIWTIFFAAGLGVASANPGWPTTASWHTDDVADLCHNFCGLCAAAGSGSVVTQATTTTRPTQATTTNYYQSFPSGTCPTGFLAVVPDNKLCIRAFMEEKSWYDAANTCATFGGTLVMPKNEDIHQFCLLFKNGVDANSKFWIGLTDVGTEGQWRYVDGTAVVGFNKWNTGEPNNSGGNEGCGEYLPAGNDMWNDLNCANPQKFICQTTYRTCPTGYLPMLQDSKLCVRAFMEEKSWYDAWNTCVTFGGTLVMPKNEDIHQFCLLLKNGADANSKFWIGLTDVGTEGQWRYADGTAVVGFNKWAAGEPNNSGGNEGCGEYLPAGNDMWNNLNCANPQKFICQTILP